MHEHEHGHEGCGCKPCGIEIKDGVARMSQTRFLVWTFFSIVVGAVIALVMAFDIVEKRVADKRHKADIAAFEAATQDVELLCDKNVALRKAIDAYSVESMKLSASGGGKPVMLPMEQTVAEMTELCAAMLVGGCELAKHDTNSAWRVDTMSAADARHALALLKKAVAYYERAENAEKAERDAKRFGGGGR